MTPEEPIPEYDRPVAYDPEGRPLYAHPHDPQKSHSPKVTQVVHMSRPIEPVKQVVSEEVKRKNELSKRRFPSLNLSEGEFVVRAVRRHPIGLFIPVGTGILLLAAVFTVMFNYDAIVEEFSLTGAIADLANAFFPLVLVGVLIGLLTYAAYFVYVNNKFFLTNESVIQEIQISLFSKHEQTVSLANIEDASYEQKGILQQILDYGSIRLSTEGDETTYHFTYVSHPKRHIATLNNAVEAFKNGRPVNEN